MKILKNAPKKNKQSNLIANMKMPNVGFIKQMYYKLKNKGGGGLFSIS